MMLARTLILAGLVVGSRGTWLPLNFPVPHHGFTNPRHRRALLASPAPDPLPPLRPSRVRDRTTYNLAGRRPELPLTHDCSPYPMTHRSSVS